MAGHPRLIFGAASFGMSFNSPAEVQSILDVLKAHGVLHLDTAGRYPPDNPGRSEELIGEVGAAAQGFAVDTKIMARGEDGELERRKIEESIASSLKRMGMSKVNTLHIHRPDLKTPLEEQAKALDDLHKSGKFDSLGVSNFQPEMLEAFLRICEEKGLVKPSVYQGEYSAVTRGMEKKLLPLLREHGMVFNAFRSVAAGFLSGRLTSGDVSGTRFDGDGPVSKLMQSLFSDERLHAALRKLEARTKSLGITTIEAALRWACYHSALTERDGIILGASRPEQLLSNLEGIRRGPLPDECVETLETVWRELEPTRGYII